MLKTLIEVYRLLDQREKKSLLKLQVLVCLMSLTELVAIASVGPFMAIVAKPEVVHSNKYLNQLYLFLECQNEYQFLVITGLTALFLLASSTAVNLFTNWRLFKFGAQLGADMATRLFMSYLRENWVLHCSRNSADLFTNVGSETQRVSSEIVKPMLIILSKMTLAISITVGVFLVDAGIAFIGLCYFSLVYAITYRIVRTRLSVNGSDISRLVKNRNLILSEGVFGFRDVLLFNKQEEFSTAFGNYGNELANRQSTNQMLAIAPRNIIEVMAFTCVILLIVYLTRTYQGDLSTVLPIVSVYAIAGFKLIPALQGIFLSFAQVKSGIPSFNNIKTEMAALAADLSIAANKTLGFAHDFTMQNVSFTYPGKLTPAIDGISLSIKSKDCIGVVGPSGSGKSTLVDIMLGLIAPDVGEIRVDGTLIDESNRVSWRRKIGFVPQSIFLFDSSIRNNIAFGETADTISEDKLEAAVRLAHVDEFTNKLDGKLDASTGDRGNQLSGGQRQRIGIARALYRNPSILIFDEATSALDGITEKIILDSIEEFHGQKTMVIVAHRLSSVQHCDVIYFVDKGRITDQGTYEELLSSNTKFRKMAEQRKPIKS
jgi:HlyD family secretion protein